MSGNTGAGPALAAHSKDASTPGPTPASEASGTVKPASDSGDAISHALQQATDFVRASRSPQWESSLLPASPSVKC
jgi:hypothetical protein